MDDELDEFVKAAPGRKPIHPVRFVVTGAIICAVVAILAPTTDELLYHFRTDPPVDVGDMTSLPAGTNLPVGARVRAHVVLGNYAAEIPLWRRGSLRVGPIVVRSIAGSPHFVEYDPKLHPTWGSFVSAEIDARVDRFDKTSELADMHAYISNQGLEIPPDARVLLVDERPGQMSTYVSAWIAGLALVIWSVLGIVRRMRHA
jgi:hypothetical protein